jgi:diadenylate cyclase
VLSPILRWQSIVDYISIAVALYFLLRWARNARAFRIVLFILFLFAGARLVQQFDLIFTSWVLEGAALATLMLLLLTFQGELRHAVLEFDNFFQLWVRPQELAGETDNAIAAAAFELARTRVGALIIIVRRDSIDELVAAGVPLNAMVSAELIRAIFQRDSPLHDGAVVIKGDRLTRASVILPLTDREDLPQMYGTRHRAAIGLGERSDAVVIAVSEERGEVTVVEKRRLRRLKDRAELALLIGSGRRTRVGLRRREMRRWLTGDIRLKLVAAGLAALVWASSFLVTGSSLRIVRVPVEFADVPAGLEVRGRSAPELTYQLRGNPWIMNSGSLSRLVAHFSLAAAHPGIRVLHPGPQNLDLPPGVVVEAVSPPEMTVRLEMPKPPVAATPPHPAPTAIAPPTPPPITTKAPARATARRHKAHAASRE